MKEVVLLSSSKDRIMSKPLIWFGLLRGAEGDGR
jgi:hypothetical protein